MFCIIDTPTKRSSNNAKESGDDEDHRIIVNKTQKSIGSSLNNEIKSENLSDVVKSQPTSTTLLITETK